MKERIKIIGMIAISTIICLGCAHPYGSPVNDHWGRSYHTALESQQLYSEKGHPAGPVAGYDGGAAANTMVKYRESFKTEVPPPIYNISFGL